MTTLARNDVLALLRGSDGLAAKDQLRETDSSDGLLDALPVLRDERETRILVDVLGERHERKALPVLVALLADPRPRVRFSVADALAKIADPAAGDALLSRLLLPDPDLDTRRMLLLALGAVGYHPAIPTLILYLKNPDSEQRSAAAWSLGTLSASEALDAVTEAYAMERNERTCRELKKTLQVLARLPGA